MGIVQEAVRAVGHAMENVHAGEAKLASRKMMGARPQELTVTSTAFLEGRLPLFATAEGGGLAPDIEWSDPPPQTKSFVVLCEDPDAPFPEPFVHWLVYGIAADARRLDAASIGAWKTGKNSKLSAEFTGAAPPPGHGEHHYHFQVFALDTSLDDLAADAGRGAVIERIGNHVLAGGELIGTYEPR